MGNTVFTKTYSAPSPHRAEIRRYAGMPNLSDETEAILEACLMEVEGRLCYRVCYRTFSITRQGEALDLGFATTRSESLKKNLLGCDRIVLFAATVGLEMDRLIARYAKQSPTKALFLDAIGAERIESLCDRFNQEVAKAAKDMGFFTRPRFSAGYGDLPLALQKEIFAALDCPRRIGLTLNESLLMSPSKSVTAMIGIGLDRESRNEETI